MLKLSMHHESLNDFMLGNNALWEPTVIQEIMVLMDRKVAVGYFVSQSL